MFLDSTVYAEGFENPANSKIVGRVGWVKHPVGTRAGSQTGGFGIAIPKMQRTRKQPSCFSSG